MSRLRIRKFNARDSYPGLDMDNDLCQAVRAGDTVYLRGQVGTTLGPGGGELVGLGDPGAQAEQAMKNVRTLLEECGAKMEDVCKMTIYVTDRAHRPVVYRAVGRALKGVHVASTGLIVSGLAKPEYLMEIDIVAVIPEGRTEGGAP